MLGTIYTNNFLLELETRHCIILGCDAFGKQGNAERLSVVALKAKVFQRAFLFLKLNQTCALTMSVERGMVCPNMNGKVRARNNSHGKEKLPMGKRADKRR